MRRGDVVVVVGQPSLGLLANLGQGAEDAHVEHAAAVAAVESFNESVLHGTPGLDELQVDASCLIPIRKRLGDEFRAVVPLPRPAPNWPLLDPRVPIPGQEAGVPLGG